MKIEVPIVNAFADDEQGGNPAGVVLGAERFSPAQKLSIAAAIGLSETAFVSPSQQAAFKLEFFTPERQIAHCGHATVATFSYLHQIGAVSNGLSSKETIDGCRAIHLDGERAYMEQRAPSYQPLSPAQHQTLLASLGLDPADLLSDLPPQVVNTGNGFGIVGLKDVQRLAQLCVDQAAVTTFSNELDLIGLYVFTPATHHPGRQASARMFAPRYGITEEAATGMAAGPLACVLYDQLGIRQPRLQIEQGYLMAAPSPSVIEVHLDLDQQGKISGLMAGGRARKGETRSVEVTAEQR
ncbi:MAG TPA: PhzF family phenazine biosynthesis protein [Motiliproteus sp.]